MTYAVPFHPLADLFPMIEGQDFLDLMGDISQHGLRQPIITLDGMILDGRNRYRACMELGRMPQFEVFTGNDPLAFVVSLNLHRRHLNESQRAMVAAKLVKADVDNGQLAAFNIAQSEAARLLNVGDRSVRRAAQVVAAAVPELAKAVEQGNVAVSAAADLSTLPAAQQRQIVARGETEILAAAKQIRLEKAQQRREAIAAVKARPVAMPEGRYGTIVIDPPWDMEKIERDVAPDQVAFDYPTMSEQELQDFPVPAMAADDCHLFLWTTQKYLPMALRLADHWGFRYVLTFVWHKPGGFQPFNLPQYNCEFAVYARRGSPEFIDQKQFFTCFQAPRREHSRKPDEFYDVVRRVTTGPRIDVFSREARDGFAQYGNEADKFGEAA